MHDDVEEGTVEGHLAGIDEDGGFEFTEAEMFTDRAPIAAVAVGQKVGSASTESLHVVCSDGACYKLKRDGEWIELEPVPGTERVGTLAAEMDALVAGVDALLESETQADE